MSHNTKAVNPPSRRRFLKRSAIAGTALAGAVLTAAPTATLAAPAINKGIKQWKMVLTWPKELPGLGAGAVRLGQRITALSEGMLDIKIYGGGELVPPLGVFDAVSQGTAELGHTAPYYWINKHPATAFFCVVPGGMTADEQNAWIYFGGGLPLWHELYAQFGLIAYPAGNTGAQMGGWFTRPIHTLDDLKGLKMRIPGMGGEVMARLGAIPQVIPSQELYTALQSGVIDALEWVGPWNDIALGFHQVADYYYGPGFHEPGPTLELMINKQAFDGLSPYLQRIIKTACCVENQLMRSEYFANNIKAFHDMKEKLGVTFTSFPPEVMQRFLSLSQEVVANVAEHDALGKKIYDSYARFRRNATAFGQVDEPAYQAARFEML